MNGSRATVGVRRWALVAAVLAVVLVASTLGALLLVPDGLSTLEEAGESAAQRSETVTWAAATSRTPAPTATPRPPQNPWRSDPIVVGITNRADRNRGYAPLVGAALDYWAANSAVYGAYTANYSLRPNASDPEIAVVFVPAIERCGDGNAESVVGCAPKLGADDHEPDGVTVRIVGSLDDASTVTTL